MLGYRSHDILSSFRMFFSFCNEVIEAGTFRIHLFRVVWNSVRFWGVVACSLSSAANPCFVFQQMINVWWKKVFGAFDGDELWRWFLHRDLKVDSEGIHSGVTSVEIHRYTWSILLFGLVRVKKFDVALETNIFSDNDDHDEISGLCFEFPVKWV